MSLCGADNIAFSERFFLNADLLDADDNTLAYLSLILPCLLPKSYKDTSIIITVRNGWSASMHTWHALDQTLLSLPRRRDTMQVSLRSHVKAAIPTWEALPYECMDVVQKEMLPGCDSQELLAEWCGNRQRCHLHGAKQ